MSAPRSNVVTTTTRTGIGATSALARGDIDRTAARAAVRREVTATAFASSEPAALANRRAASPFGTTLATSSGIPIPYAWPLLMNEADSVCVL
jgi:hypothetical protein